ncbi:PAH2 domain-containing protein [Ceratobasidium sp. AG-I]|nr:PAH2 domain-containing protein [Ceratobasidium sp. AG-I]
MPLTTETQNATNAVLGVQDASSYLEQVKSTCQDEPATYDQFLKIMKDFKTTRIQTPQVIEHVADLFRDHTELIRGFNTFLPPGYHIALEEDSMIVTTPSCTTTRALNSRL